MRYRFPNLKDLLHIFVAMGGLLTGATQAKVTRLFADVWVEGLHMLAGLIMVVIARKGPFGPRNGAMALAATELFYRANGWELVIPSPRVREDLIQRACDGSLKAADLAQLARPCQ